MAEVQNEAPDWDSLTPESTDENAPAYPSAGPAPKPVDLENPDWNDLQTPKEAAASGFLPTLQAAEAGFARRFTLGTSDLVSKFLDTPEEQEQAINAREAHPLVSSAFEFLGTAALLAATSGFGLAAGEGASLAAKIGSNAVQGAILGGVNSVTNDLAFGDPNLNASKIASNAGISSILGASFGGMVSALLDGSSSALKNLQTFIKAYSSSDLSISPDVLGPLDKIRMGAMFGFGNDSAQKEVVSKVSSGINALNDLASIDDLSASADISDKPLIDNFEASRKEFLKQFGKENAGNEKTINGGGNRQAPLGGEIPSHTTPLEGLPSGSPGPNESVQQLAQEYTDSKGIDYQRPQKYVTADPEVSAKIAQAFDAMKHDPQNPEVQSAYQALIKETLDQYQTIKKSGLNIEAIQPGQPNPYPNGSKDFLQDIKNGHLWFFPTDQGFGSLNDLADHPLNTPTNEMLNGKPLLANDVFRIVHDVFGHAKEGLSTGPNGEENAWLSHLPMYSDEAQKALTTETRGQNSWVNFGPYGEANRANPLQTTYADQKAGLLPDWVRNQYKSDPSFKAPTIVDPDKLMSIITNASSENKTSQVIAFNHFVSSIQGLSKIKPGYGPASKLLQAQKDLQDWLDLLPYTNQTSPYADVEYGGPKHFEGSSTSDPGEPSAYSTKFDLELAKKDELTKEEKKLPPSQVKSKPPLEVQKPMPFAPDSGQAIGNGNNPDSIEPNYGEGVTLGSGESTARVPSFGSERVSPFDPSYGPSFEKVNSQIKAYQKQIVDLTTQILRNSSQPGSEGSEGSEVLTRINQINQSLGQGIKNVSKLSNANQAIHQTIPPIGAGAGIIASHIPYGPQMLALYSLVRHYSGDGGLYRLGNTIGSSMKVIDGVAGALPKVDERILKGARLIFTGASSQARKVVGDQSE